MKQHVVAIIPGAGAGARFGAEYNKAFFEILGKPIMIHALEVFQNLAIIAEIVPVLSETDMERGLRLIEQYGLDKIKKIAPGGKERQDSVYNALKQVGNRKSVVVIHDAARPLVTPGLIERSVRALRDCDGVVPAIPLRDTIKEVREGRVLKTIARETLVSVQTPQVFRHDTLLRAYESMSAKNVLFTDDAAVVEAAGGSISVIEGSSRNIKVTTPEDALFVETCLKAGGDG